MEEVTLADTETEKSTIELTRKQKTYMARKRRNVTFLVVVLLLLIVSSVGLVKNLWTSDGAQVEAIDSEKLDFSEDPNAKKGGMGGLSKEEIQAELNKQVEEGMINISMNTNPVFKDGDSEGNLLLVNEDINRYAQVVEIYRDDTNDLVYRSGSIPVGSRVETAKLSKSLDKGEYPCTAIFMSVNPETNTVLGKAGAKIVLTVQK